MSYVRNYSVNDGPEVVDEIYTQFYSKGGGGVFAVDECKSPQVRKISRHAINSCAIDDPGIIDELEAAICPICGDAPDIDDTVLYINPYNGRVSWLCDTCSKPPMSVWKWDRWHPLPAYKRRQETSATDNELYNTIVAHNGQNIKTLACILGWTYGKTRGACKRLEAETLIRIEKSHENNYYETKIYIIT